MCQSMNNVIYLMMNKHKFIEDYKTYVYINYIINKWRLYLLSQQLAQSTGNRFLGKSQSSQLVQSEYLTLIPLVTQVAAAYVALYLVLINITIQIRDIQHFNLDGTNGKGSSWSF